MSPANQSPLKFLPSFLLPDESPSVEVAPPCTLAFWSIHSKWQVITIFFSLRLFPLTKPSCPDSSSEMMIRCGGRAQKRHRRPKDAVQKSAKLRFLEKKMKRFKNVWQRMQLSQNCSLAHFYLKLIKLHKEHLQSYDPDVSWGKEVGNDHYE